MTTVANTRERTKTTGKTKALVAVLLMAAMMVAGLLGAGPAEASTFPGKNGNIVFSSTRDGNDEIYSMRPDGTGQTRLTNHPANDFGPAVSPDGTRIAFESTRSGVTDIYVMDADGTDPVQITTNSFREGDPTWSPDGEKIAFIREVAKDDLDIAVMNADGSGVTPIAFGPNDESEPTFAPDGERIAFRSDLNGEDQIFTMDADGSNKERLTSGTNEEFHPTWSPNGKKVVFSSRAFPFNVPAHIARINADGTGQKLLTNGPSSDFQPAYSPDGKKIAFAQLTGTASNIFTMNADGTRQKRLTDAGSSNTGADWGPATPFTVNASFDSQDLNPGDGRCDAVSFQSGDQCTLRAAIQESNASAGPGFVGFAIPGTGVQTIRPKSPLPPVSDPLTIDGYTQPGAKANTATKGTNAQIKIDLDGSETEFVNGLLLTGPGSTVRGLAIHGFGVVGILITDSAEHSTIQGNFVGTNATGTLALGNDNGGIFSDTSANTIGGASPAARNLVSGNRGTGVFVQDDTPTGNGSVVLGNLIGTTRNGTGPLANGDAGVIVNFATGVRIGDGTLAGSNTIAFNRLQGIGVSGPTGGVAVSRNSIFSNGGLGIDLVAEFGSGGGRTANDPGDVDSGPNGFQNFPVLTSAKKTSTGTKVAGTLGSAPNKTYKLRFFSNPSGADEGKAFIGQKGVTTNSSGNASFTFSTSKAVARGQTITATATDPARNTSEFSARKTVVLSSGSNLAPETTKLSGPSGVEKSAPATFGFESSGSDAKSQCRLDGGDHRACASSKKVLGPSESRHVFRARAKKDGRADPTPAVWRWEVDRHEK